MIQHQGIWLPDGETHLVDWMTRAGEIVDGKGTYQIRKLRKALEYCTNWRTAVDVGAHAGLWTMQLLKQFEMVHAFEPVSAHLACLLQNTIGLQNMTFLGMALGEKEGLVSIHTASTSSGDSWIDGNGDIEMRTLDSFEFEDVDFIKIDCEGYEYFVLQGAKDTLKRCRPCIIVEQKPGHAQRFGIGERDAVTYLQQLGAVLRAEMSGDFILSFP